MLNPRRWNRLRRPLMPRRSAADQQTAAAAVVPEGKKAKLPDRLRQTDKQLSGEGQRLGTAYRLKNGDVVYVPDPAR